MNHHEEAAMNALLLLPLLLSAGAGLDAPLTPLPTA